MYSTLKDVVDNNPSWEWLPMIIGRMGNQWVVVNSVDSTIQEGFKTHQAAKDFALGEKKRLGL